MDPIPPVDKVYSLLIQEEKQRSVGQGSNNGPFIESTTALAAKTMTIGSKNTCSHCGLLGHTVEKCYKIHGYPPDTRPSQGPIKYPFLNLIKNLLQLPHSHNNPFSSHLSSARSCLS